MTEADFVCSACPRKCGALRNVSLADPPSARPGFCRSPLNPVIARAGLHFWEEPVISGTKGSGTVFFSGCNLKCVFCQNYGISTGGQGKEVPVSRLREIYLELISQGAHNINLVTPSHYTHAILESLREALPVPVVYNTNACDLPETLRKLEGKVQIYLPDLKYAENDLAVKYSAMPGYFETATAAILEMYRQTGPYEIGEDGLLKKGVIIRHLILPGHVRNSLMVLQWVKDHFHPGEVLFSLMRQYLPCGRVSDREYPELNRRVTALEYRRVREAMFRYGIEDGFLQEEHSASREFIPCFDLSGV